MENDLSGKKLYRSTQGQMIGGVCAGFAEFLNIDVTLVRILWVVLTIFGGAGVLLYLICLMIVPRNPNSDQTMTPAVRTGSESWGMYVGIGLVLLGVWIFMDRQFFWFPFHLHWHFWRIPRHIIFPGILIVLGLLLVLRGIHSPTESADASGRSFTRSRSQRMLSGVCGGLAQYFQVDVTLVRVAYVVLTLLTAFWLGVIAYVVMAAAVPEESPNRPL